MQFRINYSEESPKVECRNNESDEYYACAGFDKDSRLIFFGDLTNQMCNEIEHFLETQCIHIDEKGIAYQLTN